VYYDILIGRSSLGFHLNSLTTTSGSLVSVFAKMECQVRNFLQIVSEPFPHPMALSQNKELLLDQNEDIKTLGLQTDIAKLREAISSKDHQVENNFFLQIFPFKTFFSCFFGLD